MEFDIIKLKEIDSTNKYCYKLGKKGKRNLIVVSDIQTGGVGRLERKWYSNFGGLYFSMLLDLEEFKKRCSNNNIGKLNFLGSLSVVETLKCYLKNGNNTYNDIDNNINDNNKVNSAKYNNNNNLGIKFPNDVIVRINNNDKKLSGILSEVNMNYGFLVLGVGVNINNSIPNEIKDIAISLKELGGKEFDRFNILDKYICNFENNYFLDDDKILKKYKRYSLTIGKYVKIITPNKEIKGKVLNIDYNGIYLENHNEIEHISVGDCIHLR
ncbi:biotin--[acetyl-CoA-carboxylase] ligase [Methanothermococcus okinawensis]|uniref:Biotin/acetyl-CoA-carboxylase ligase n=1 Tax=Methanothermococcus okinawensis (strain DSM 14208 / JCM 11175 / IH1) TaxID=647113 RepID=F8AMR7_METOI|nr:biotin--[acetyl-CoA-carboxylase] ligase [Methanothermococcus okinawensis]AEH06898.1 biotin/acetyl-CoA-carboxylase ligase [Methanothermococcus okinawensis IH1]